MRKLVATLLFTVIAVLFIRNWAGADQSRNYSGVYACHDSGDNENFTWVIQPIPGLAGRYIFGTQTLVTNPSCACTWTLDTNTSSFTLSGRLGTETLNWHNVANTCVCADVTETVVFAITGDGSETLFSDATIGRVATGTCKK
jgi:hypothetical protein